MLCCARSLVSMQPFTHFTGHAAQHRQRVSLQLVSRISLPLMFDGWCAPNFWKNHSKFCDIDLDWVLLSVRRERNTHLTVNSTVNQAWSQRSARKRRDEGKNYSNVIAVNKVKLILWVNLNIVAGKCSEHTPEWYYVHIFCLQLRDWFFFVFLFESQALQWNKLNHGAANKI